MKKLISSIKLRTSQAEARQKHSSAAFESPKTLASQQSSSVDQMDPVPVDDTPRLSLMSLPELALHKVLAHLPAKDFVKARSTSKALAKIGEDPALRIWEALLNQDIARANSPDQVVALIRQAAQRGVLQNVERLELSKKNLRAEHLEQILRLIKDVKSSKLQHLDLSRNYSLGAAGAKAIAEAKCLPSLQYLDLSWNELGTAGAKVIAEAEYLPSLESLHLGYNKIGDAGAQAIAKAKYLPSLKSLDLSYSRIGEAGAQAIAATTLTFLQCLILKGNNLRAAGTKAIAETKNLPFLQYLDLSWSGLSALGAKAIAEAKGFPSLQHLDLSRNDLFAAGAQALAEAKGLPFLQHLDLRHNYLGDAGAKAIAETKGFPSLKSLDLSYNQMGDAGKQAIMAVEHLVAFEIVYH